MLVLNKFIIYTSGFLTNWEVHWIVIDRVRETQISITNLMITWMILKALHRYIIHLHFTASFCALSSKVLVFISSWILNSFKVTGPRRLVWEPASSDEVSERQLKTEEKNKSRKLRDSQMFDDQSSSKITRFSFECLMVIKFVSGKAQLLETITCFKMILKFITAV